MIKIKKKIYFIITSLIIVVVSLTIILFFYAAFFYEPSVTKIQENETQTEEIEKVSDIQSDQIKENEIEKTEEIIDQPKVEKVVDVPKIEKTIKDGLFAVVGDKAITKSDIVDEIKTILILNNMSYSDEKRDQLQKMAIKSTLKRKVKEIAISTHALQYNYDDVNNELNRLASKINVDVDTLKNIFTSNGMDFEMIKDQVKTELLWNSLIFYLYGDRVSINLDEIEEQLKLNQNKKEFNEYLISEIVLKPVEKEKLESKIEEIKNKIKTEGFENVAINLSISQTAEMGGDLGWLNENSISKKFRTKIINTSVGNISEPILLNEGILIFMVRDKRKVKNEINLEELKNQLVNTEKSKILNMYSMSHYDKLRRSISIKFFQ